MAISWGDVLSVGAGMAERDSEYKDLEFKQALENFKDDKAQVRKLADLRYTRDLKKYDDEVAKYDSLKSAYSWIQENNIGADTAANMIAMERMGETKYNLLSSSEKLAAREDIKSGFVWNYYTKDDKEVIDGTKKEGDKKSFTIKHDKQIPHLPKATDYYLGNEYWQEKSKDIGKDASGPLGDEIKRLLNKEDKSVDVSSYIADLEAKSVTDVKGILAGEFETYTSTNVSTTTDSNVIVSGQLKDNYNKEMKDIVIGGGKDIQIYNSKEKEKGKIETETTYQNNVLNAIDKFSPGWKKKNAKWDRERKTWVIDEKGALVYGQMEALWNDASQHLWQRAFYKGGDLSAEDYSFAAVKRHFEIEAERRKLTNLKLDGTLIIDVNAMKMGLEINKKGVTDYLNTFIKSDEFKTTFGKNAVIENAEVNLALQNKVKEYITSQSKEPSSGKVKMKSNELLLIIQSNPSISKEEVIKNLEENGVEFEEGVKEKILGMGEYEIKQNESDKKLPFEPNKIVGNK